MTESEIEQVIDYVIFLSMRGETELGLIDEAVDLRRERSRGPGRRDRQGDRRRRLQQVEGGRDARWSIRRSRARRRPARASSAAATCSSAEHDRTRSIAPVPRPAGRWATAPSFVDAGRLQRRRLRRQSQRAGRSGSTQLRREDQDALEPEARRRLGQPAPPGEPEPRRLQGRPPADRPLLADRQGDQRGQDAGALSDAIEPEQIWDLVNFVLALPYEPELLEGRDPAAARPAAAQVARR